tara:strand:+ start:1498 stop:1887 length:390 start_codon:yes stop_codon:yes gene_type:complete
MATKLTKPIVRETEISGEDYIVTLTMTDVAGGDGILYGDPLVTLRKKGSRGTPLGFPLKDLLEESPKEEAPAHYHDMISYTDIMSKLGGLRSKEAEPLKEIVRDIFEVNVLASDLSDEEVEKKGVALPE